MLALIAAMTLAPETFRAAAYNLEWFPDEPAAGRVANLKSVIGNIKPDVLAMEEVRSLKGLRAFLGSEWTIGMDDDPKEAQELAIAVKAPYKLIRAAQLFPGPELDNAFPNRRDVLRAEVETPSGQKVFFYVCHLKSRGGPSRLGTDSRRESAARLLSAFIKGQPSERHVVLGDMNDTPDDRSMRILATGNPDQPAGRPAKDEKPFLRNLFSDAYRKDVVSLGLSDLFNGDPIPPVVPGAYEDNERLRGKEYRFPRDVRVKQVLFDQIFVSPNINATEGTVYAGVDALRGSESKIRLREGGVVEDTAVGTRVSDHLPVYADLTIE